MEKDHKEEAGLKVKRWPKDTIAAGRRHTVGLKSDGTVAVGNVHMATNTGNAHTIGLKSDGTVIAAGDNEYGQCDVSSWRGILA